MSSQASFTDWKKIQEVAQHLFEEGKGEAWFRSSINRAYYAAFHISMGFAQIYLGFQKSREGTDHARIIESMKKCAVEQVREAGRNLKRLQDKRRTADYDDMINILQKDAQYSVLTASKIIGICNDSNTQAACK